MLKTECQYVRWVAQQTTIKKYLSIERKLEHPEIDFYVFVGETKVDVRAQNFKTFYEFASIALV